MKAKPGLWELYDIAADRTEIKNLADEHPDVVARMKAELEQWQLSVISSYNGGDYGRKGLPGGGKATVKIHRHLPGGGKATVKIHRHIPGGGEATVKIHRHIPGGGEATMEIHRHLPGVGEATVKIHRCLPGAGGGGKKTGRYSLKRP